MARKPLRGNQLADGPAVDEVDVELLRGIADTASLAVARRAAGLTAAAAPRRLHGLTRRCGVAVASVSGDGAALTPAGRLVLSAGTSLLTAITAGARRVAATGTPGVADLHLLRVVHGTGSLNRAAGVLRISQPALSRRVDRLENALGVRLLVRGRRGSGLAPGAHVLLAETAAAEAALRFALARMEGTP